MESRSLSMKPHGLSLVTRGPISSSLPPCHVGLLRREFLGYGHNLRLPHRECKKLRLKSHSRYNKFLLKASLDAQSIVAAAAAVAAVGAVTVAFFTHFRKQLDIKEAPGRLSLSLSEQPRGTTSWTLTESHPVNLRTEVSNVDSDDVHKEFRESSGADRDIVYEVKLMGSEKVPGEALTPELSQYQLRMVAPNFHETALTEASSLPTELSGLDISPLVTGNDVVYSAVHEQVVPNAAELSFPHIQTNLSTAPAEDHTDHIKEETDEPVRFRLQSLKEGVISNSGLILRDFVGKELYTINESSMEMLDSLEHLSSCATLQKNKSYSSLMKNLLTKGTTVTASNVILPTEKFEGKIHVGYYYSQRIFCQQQDSRNKKELKKKGKRIFHQEKTQKFSPSSNPEGKGIDNIHNPSWQLRVYNQLLREGRVNDCIELLEDLERNGLLDMDKIYHVRFFEACKSQKSVKEALRFTKLISNPTLSTFNMLMSVCACSHDSEGAFQVLEYVRDAGLNADCKLYTTLISTCAKSGKVDTMFKVFHEMVNAGVEPNLHTYGALIDGCAKAGQVAKAFGAYGILRSKNVKPDRVIFNALITACGQSRAVDRAFDVLAEMGAEIQPIDPDHVTVGALMKACASAGQVDRAREVYKMIHKYDIRGTAELYTIAINSCSHHGDWEFACSVYDDMIRKGVAPDEMFISALIDVAGHAEKVDAAFEILQTALSKGMHVGIISYSSLMGACSNARDWQKALELYAGIKHLNLKPSVSMMNALITALCRADKLQKAMETLFEMKSIGLSPNMITYSILLATSEKIDDLEAGLMLIAEAKKDGVGPNLLMCRCVVAMCLRRFQKASTLGEPVLSFTSGQGQLNSKWTSLALMVYRETIAAGAKPTMDELSLVLGCLQLPHDFSVRNRLIEFLGVNSDTSKVASLCSRIDGFGVYDPRVFSLIEEAASLGVIPFISLKESPIVVDVRNFQVHTAEVYLLTVLKCLKHRLAAGAKLPNLTILLPVEDSQIQSSTGEKTINIAGRISQAVAAVLRRLGLSYQGNESYGKIRIKGVTLREWFQPKLDSPSGARTRGLSSSLRRLGSGISRQQRRIRTGHLSLQ